VKIGIIGYAGSGKTSLSVLLSGKKVESFDPHQPAVLVAKIVDLRLKRLVDKVTTEKVVFPQVTLLDFKGGTKETGFDQKTLAGLGGVDFVMMVLDGFSDGSQPASDLFSLHLEMVYYDQQRLATIMERREAEVEKHGHRQPNPAEDIALKEALSLLDSETPLRLMEEESKQRKAFLESLGLISNKKALLVFNGKEASPDFSEGTERLKLPTIFWDLSLPKSDSEIFSFWQKLLSVAGLITFYTTSLKETRAWLLPKGSSVVEAAGKIHSDFARGFIKAEVVNFEDFQKVDSFADCRQKGFLRLEGRDYQVVDGDILKIRFAT